MPEIGSAEYKKQAQSQILIGNSSISHLLANQNTQADKLPIIDN